MPSDLPQRLCASGLFAPRERVVCAVSGGADSMALLTALWQCRDSLQIRLAAAHFNHNLRAGEAQRDEDFVRNFCQSHNIPLYVDTADVRAYAADAGESVEQAARTLRYAFLQALPCDKIATAHTADDNAETVLMNLLRGTGLRGLCGIPAQRGKLVRPFLTVTRKEIEAYLAQERIDHVEDSTNADDNALRNRIRHQMIPLCKQENGNFLQAVSQMTAQLHQDEQLLTVQAEQGLAACRVSGGYRVSTLLALPDGLRQRVLRLLLEHLAVPRATHRHVEALEGLLQSRQPAAQIALPGGIRAARQYDLLCFEPLQPPTFVPVALRPDGLTSLPELHLNILCRPAKAVVNTTQCFTVVPHGEITVRPRAVGDKITLPGGTKTLKKWMIDAKIPRHLRQALPVLADKDGVLAVYSLGVNHARIGIEQALTVQFLQEGDAPSILSKVRGQEFET